MAKAKPQSKPITTIDILEAIGCTENMSKGAGYVMCLCPFHEETNPSLQVNTEERRGRPEGYAYCYGCGQVIRNPVDLVTKLLERLGNLPSYVNQDEVEKYRFLLKPYIEKTFEFKDLAGNTLYYQEIIYNPAKGKKEARYYRIEKDEDGNERKVYSLEGIDPLPYGLHTYDGQGEIYVFESPQDAEAWLSLFPGDAVFATCGATNWHRSWHEQILPELKRRGVKYAVLIPQNDPAAHGWTSNVFKRFAEHFETYICWICKNRAVKDISDIVYQLPDDWSDQEFLDEIRKSLTNDLPLLWKLNLHDKYAFDLQEYLTVKIQKDKQPVLFPFIVYPSKIYLDAISEDMAAIEVTYLGQDGKEKTYLVRALTPAELSKISFFDEETLRAMARFLSFIIHANYTIIPKDTVIAKTGWKDGEYICPITIDAPLLEGAKLVISQSSEKEAEDNIRWIIEQMCHSPIVIPMLFALAVPYMDRGAILEIIGSTTTGKTFTLEVTANLFGYEEVDKWWGTANALIERLSIFDRFPLFIDEVHLISKEDLMVVIYSLTSGQSKARLSRDAKIRDVKRFSTGILSTGEKSVVDICEKLDDYYPGGLITRTITIPLKSQAETFNEPDPDALEVLKDELRARSERARGWLLKLWFDRVKDWIEIRRIEDSHVKGVIKGMYHIAEKLHEINLASKFAVSEIHKRLDELQMQSGKTRNELKERLDGRTELTQYIIENMNKFIPRDTTTAPDRREIWGWIEDESDTDKVYMMRRRFKKICRDELRLAPDSVLEKGLEEGWIENTSIWISYLGNTYYVLKIHLSEDLPSN